MVGKKAMIGMTCNTPGLLQVRGILGSLPLYKKGVRILMVRVRSQSSFDGDTSFSAWP